LVKALPAVFGADVPKGNYADMTTRGWELSLSWHDNFTLANKPFNYDIRFTLADYTSKIDKYNNPEKNLGSYYEGMTVGEIWGYVTEGFFTSAEDIAIMLPRNCIMPPIRVHGCRATLNLRISMMIM